MDQIAMTGLPVVIGTHFFQAELQHLADGAALVGVGGDALQSLQFALALIKVAQPLFGDRFGFQPDGAFAHQPALQPGDFGALVGWFRLRRQGRPPSQP